jgi:hypothetical protein
MGKILNKIAKIIATENDGLTPIFLDSGGLLFKDKNGIVFTEAEKPKSSKRVDDLIKQFKEEIENPVFNGD